MATKYCSTGVLDSLLTYVIYANGGGNLKLVIVSSCAVVPTIANVSSNSTDYYIAASTLPGFPTSDNIGSIASSGNNRCLTIAACSCDTVINTGIASYVAIVADSSSVRYLTTCTTQTLTSGNKVNIGTWSITVNQPS